MNINRAIAKTIVDEKETLFVHLQDAFDNAMENNVPVYPVREISATYDLHVDDEKTVTFNTYGYSVHVSGDITNNGIFNLNGNIELPGNFINNGNANLSNGTMSFGTLKK